MPSREATKLIVVLTLAPFVAWLSATKRGERILAWAIVATILLFGVAGIMTRRITGKHGAGVMTGDTALFVGIVLVGASLYFAWALVKTPITSTPSQRKEKPNQPLQRNASTKSVSNFESPARRG